MKKYFLLLSLFLFSSPSISENKSGFNGSFNKEVFTAFALKGAGKQEEVFKIYKELSDKDVPFAAYVLSGLYMSGAGVAKNEDRASKLKLKAARLGYIWAQLDLIPETDVNSQGRILLRASSIGDPMAQLVLAEHINEANGVPRDPLAAKSLVDKALTSNYCDPLLTQYLDSYTSQVYENGYFGVEKDAKFAAKVVEKAAACGDPHAMERMGKFLWNGQGVPQDKVAAVQMFNVAIAIGGKESEKSIENYLKRANALEQLRVKPKASSYGWRVGMTKDEVLASSRYKPLSKYTYTTANGMREQWVYSGIVSNYAYLFFDENGRLYSYFETNPD